MTELLVIAVLAIAFVIAVRMEYKAVCKRRIAYQEKISKTFFVQHPQPQQTGITMKLYDTNSRNCLLGWFEGNMSDLTSSDEITKSFPKAKKIVLKQLHRQRKILEMAITKVEQMTVETCDEIDHPYY